MNFKNKYNNFIQEIEDAVDRREDQIPELIAKRSGTNLRLLADAFQYITDMTLAQYIRQRRLVKSMQFKHNKDCSMED